MSKTKVIGLNTNADGNARCIKAGYFKILGDISGCVTTLATKDNLVAEFYDE